MAQRVQAITAYAAVGPGSDSKHVGQVGFEAELPIARSINVTVHGAGILIGMACAGDVCRDVTGVIGEIGVNSVGRGVVAVFGGISAGLATIEGAGTILSVPAGVQIGRRWAFRLGGRLQFLLDDSTSVFPIFAAARFTLP